MGSFESAYAAGLENILAAGRAVPSVRDPNSIASDFGARERPYRELLQYAFALDDARPSILISKARPVRAAYSVGLFLWNLSGSGSAEWIGYYHSAAARFADDNMRLCGAFGQRMWRQHGGQSQIDAALALLEHDPASRRAYISILDASDLSAGLRDYPCAIGLQLFLRDGKLDMAVHMRAQQALTVLPYDVFVFAAFQTVFAARLETPIGRYHHAAGTFHIYDSELDSARAVIAEKPTAWAMPPIDPADIACSALLQFEQSLREAVLADDAGVDALIARPWDLTTFQGASMAILQLHAWSRRGGRAVDHPEAALADAGFQQLISGWSI